MKLIFVVYVNVPPFCFLGLLCIAKTVGKRKERLYKVFARMDRNTFFFQEKMFIFFLHISPSTVHNIIKPLTDLQEVKT